MRRVFHEIAELFPLIEGQELLDLAQDIKERGLHHPILLHPDGSILDGRNRYRACELVGIEPHYETWDGQGSLFALIVSLNLRRRHLNESQRAYFAAKALPLYAKEAKERQSAPGQKHELVTNLSEAGRARDRAGTDFRVGGVTIQHAKNVLDHGADELKAAVESGKLAASTAAAIVDLPKDEQTALVKKGKKAVIQQAKHRTQQRRTENRASRVATAAKTAVMPKGQFHCLVIDPPWEMEKIERDERPKQVGFEYPTMGEAELLALPIQRLAFKNCHLYLWTTHKHLPLALQLAEAWGFKYECLMTWVKNVGFTPFSWMRSTEHVLFCRRGKLDLQKVGVRLDFGAKVQEHSRKPDVFYDVVRLVSPGPRLDMFSRQEHDGFEGWGNEKDKFGETERDWNYSDGFLGHAKVIIGEHLLVAAPMEIDTKEASDIIFLVSGRGDVAFRVRRPTYMSRYPYDITFRSDREGFAQTELDKVLDGKARWMLYGFGAEDGKTLARWVMLDLNAFRAAILRGQLKRPSPTQNGDGTGFIAFDTRILRGIDATIIFAASYEIPSAVLPVEPRETSQGFWKKRMQGDR